MSKKNIKKNPWTNVLQITRKILCNVNEQMHTFQINIFNTTLGVFIHVSNITC
jgi:hypothetical protein